MQALDFVGARTSPSAIASSEPREFGDVVLQRSGRIQWVGLPVAPGVKGRVKSASGGAHSLNALEGRWFSELIRERREWLVTGGGAVALSAQRADVQVSETLGVAVVERTGEPCRS